VNGRPAAAVPRIALRWPEEVAGALGVSRSWLYESGLAGELRFVRSGKVRLVLVAELEKVIERLSARWDE
jgi:excisionase family DNA binding protein